MRTKAEELRGAQEHFDKYERLAQSMGIRALVASVPFDAEALAVAHAADPHLNSLALAAWDARDGHVRLLYVYSKEREAGGWSLCNTVCVLKHVARHHILKVPRPA